MRELHRAFLVLLGLILLPISAAAEKRVALVIGNAAYNNSSPLRTPVNEATAVAAMFRNLGFDVVQADYNLAYMDFRRAVRRFESDSADADIAVVYFSGHGIQVGGTNYLLPVDAKLASESDVQDEALPLDRIVSAIGPAKKLSLIILDASRDNLFTSTMLRKSTRSINQGLAQYEPPPNTLTVYSARAGSVAVDTDGEVGVFTAALLKNLVIPGLDIRIALGRAAMTCIGRPRVSRSRLSMAQLAARCLLWHPWSEISAEISKSPNWPGRGVRSRRSSANTTRALRSTKRACCSDGWTANEPYAT